MKVGLMLPPQADPAETVAAAKEAERRGFDYVACGEHVFFHGPTPNAFVSLAAAAGATERIRLLSLDPPPGLCPRVCRDGRSAP